jgi:hypothetical protein
MSLQWRVARLGVLVLAACGHADGQAGLQRSFEHANLRVNVQYASADAARRHAQVESLLRGGLSVYTSLFGGLPREPSGRPYAQLRVALSLAERGEGSADAGVVQVALGWEPMFGFYTWQMTLLHELFHLWSAESFRYRTGEEQWFNEGAAEFYTLQTAARLGLITSDEVPATFAVPIGFYNAARGLGTLSMRAAGSTPASKFEHYFLVYHGGFTSLFTLDYQIRRRTNGQKSLDDLMRWLYQNFDAQTRRYSLVDLERGLRETSGVDFSEFMGTHVAGTQAIQVGRYVNLGELSLELARNSVRPTNQRVVSDSVLLRSIGLK